MEGILADESSRLLRAGLGHGLYPDRYFKSRTVVRARNHKQSL